MMFRLAVVRLEIVSPGCSENFQLRAHQLVDTLNEFSPYKYYPVRKAMLIARRNIFGDYCALTRWMAVGRAVHVE